jgi:hypothetical protein
MSKGVIATVCAWISLIGFSVASTAGAAEFTLLKGKGTEVCEAYVKRLNEPSFSPDYGPLCGRSEDTSVLGFTKLTRVTLSYDELYAIGDLLLGFYSNSDQDYLKKLSAEQLAVCDQPGREKHCESVLAEKHGEESQGLRWHSQLDTVAMRMGREFAWSYEPAVDIDNDGKPDPVLLLQRRCDGVLRQGAYAYVMTNDSYLRVDEARTRAVFGHPHRQWPEGLQKYKGFRYIGLRNGVFVYHDQSYFDTFLSSVGDFNDERRNDPAQPFTLGVFHHRGGHTDQVCEIRWAAPPDAFVK